MREDEEGRRPKPPMKHEIGCDLAGVSVAELGERIELLRAEIARLQHDAAAKRSSREAASAFFKA